MAQPDTPTPPPDSGSDAGFDFELTPIEEARKILDAESISQFDVVSLDKPERWKRLRRASMPSDRALTGRAIDWLLSLPPALRPNYMTRHFPRVVNALAEVWHEPEQCQAAFARLLHDSRKGRKGFPAEVIAELTTLQNWTQVF